MASGGIASWLILGALTAVASLVFWGFDALPFQDLPAHAGLIAMRHRFGSSPFEQTFFVFAPHLGPYSLFRFLGESLGSLLGPVRAVRAIATLPLLATPAALLFARRRLHGDVSLTAGYLGIALSFGLMTLLGFASYLLGVAVMLFGLTLWLELLADADDGRPTLAKEVVVAAYALLVFVAHGHAFLLFLVLAGVASVSAGRRSARLLRLRALVPSVAVAGWVAWLERATTSPAGSVPSPEAVLLPRFQGPIDKLSLLFTPTLMTRTGIDILVGIVLWVLLIGAAIATLRALRSHGENGGRAPKHSRALYAGAACLSVVFLALPHAIGWFGFVDGRLVPLLLLLPAMAYEQGALGPYLRTALVRGAPVLAGTIVAVVLGASFAFQAEARGYKETLAVVPAQARLLNLPIDPNSDIFTAHPFVHYDKLVLADRPTVVSDVWFHQGTALYPTAANPTLRLPSSYSESDLRSIDWPGYRLDDWDYVLIRTRPEANAPWVPETLKLAKHAGGWWLYRTHAGA
jgi:hypothetical protein